MRSDRSTNLLEKISCFLIFTMLAAAISAMAGGEFWDKKEYTEWTIKECQKLLEKSPWVEPYKRDSQQNTYSFGSSSATDSQAPYVLYSIQLRSAKPVQLAMIRQQQIAAKYESLTPEQKQQFDQSSEAFMKSIPVDGIVFHVTYSTNNQQNEREMITYWQTKTTELVKNSMYLYTKKEKIPVALFVPGQGGRHEFQLIFPRTVNGQPIFTPEDKTMKLQFTYPVVGGIGDGNGFIELKLEKMKFKDQIAY
jgi:hypothetical protein